MKIGKWFSEFGMVFVAGMVFVLCSVFVDNFMSGANLINLGLSVVTVGLVACAMMFCLAGGDFDLSVGSTLAVGGMTAVLISNATGSLFLGMVAAILVGMVVGMVNGFFISVVGINALITTLASMQIMRGIANIQGEGKTVSSQLEVYGYVADSAVMGIPMPLVILVVVFGVFGFLLNKTVYGRNTLAIGGNQEAAKLAGINVWKTKIAVFAVSGVMAAMAGIIDSSRAIAASNNAGDKLELKAISACVLGGVSLTGGQATMTGVIVGVLIMGMIENAMNLKGIDSFYQMVVTGVVLLIAVTVDRLKARAIKS